MKKLLLGCLLVLVFLPLAASADVIILDSRAGVALSCVGDSRCTGVTSTVAITPNGAWSAPFGSSVWVSWAQTGTPDLSPSTANGTVMTVTDSFTSPFPTITLSVMADDTTGVNISGGAFSYAPALGGGNTYTTCSDFVIGCRLYGIGNLGPTAGIFNIVVTPNTPYTITFDTHQEKGSSFGLDYHIVATPEPASLALLGSGLLGLAAMARKKTWGK